MVKSKPKNRLKENSIYMINEMRGSKNKIKNRLKGNPIYIYIYIYMINNIEGLKQQ